MIILLYWLIAVLSQALGKFMLKSVQQVCIMVYNSYVLLL